ncbi:hypothetical protein ACJJTC_008738 [Scirpophaga incertulas]
MRPTLAVTPYQPDCQAETHPIRYAVNKDGGYSGSGRQVVSVCRSVQRADLLTTSRHALSAHKFERQYETAQYHNNPGHTMLPTTRRQNEIIRYNIITQLLLKVPLKKVVVVGYTRECNGAHVTKSLAAADRPCWNFSGKR